MFPFHFAREYYLKEEMGAKKTAAIVMRSSDFILGNSICDTLNDRSVALKMIIKVIGDGKLEQYYFLE
ncbi:hypothetical protein AAGG52_14820 [Bacillus licheniformis]